jgi:hypothetical protein
MHPNFADWYQPVTFGHDRDTLELRWKGVEAAVEDLDVSQELELVRFVYGRPPESPDFMDVFRKYFKDNDPTFKSSGNDRELQVLAGCVLAILCIEDYNTKVSVAILTASTCQIRDLKVDIGLVRMATDRVKRAGIDARKRPSIVKSQILSCNETLEEEIQRLNDQPNCPTSIAVLQQIGPIQKIANEEIMLLQKVLNIQDEELQMLWWVIGGWSDMWEKTFTNIESNARPLLLAKEAASMTDQIFESPSLKALFSRVHIGIDTKLTIPETVNSCGTEYLKMLAPRNTLCTTIFPLHSAIVRALETNGGSGWITNWSRISDIGKKTQFSSIDLAVQFYRELKLMNSNEAADD